MMAIDDRRMPLFDPPQLAERKSGLTALSNCKLRRKNFILQILPYYLNTAKYIENF